ncbi:MAG: UDP-N-acetylmuramoyl-L-alanine--D-glutamate ligase [Elusimicrobia bacterium]|nr:UDP-N-acetylmuramoyl-L-alanine--D-glutamate ligase [Elusimicrobiota bacterium]
MTSLVSHPALAYWFRGKSACVIGLGKSGAAAASFLHRCGARVSVTEKRPRRDVVSWIRRLPKGVTCETGGHRLLARPWDLVVASPGVPAQVWRDLRGTVVWGELELGYRVLSLAGRWPRRVAAVTGTNGKTTTTALLGEIFNVLGEKTVVAGNIGTPLCEVLDVLSPEHVLILEVSSYQLETAQAFRPSVGTVLNVTPDHLGRHQTMENYARTKFRLFQNQSPADAAVLNAADPWDRRLAKDPPGQVYWFGHEKTGAPGVYHVRGRLESALPGAEGSWPVPRCLPGRHNIENALAAVACARFLGASRDAIGRALRTFRGVEHRLEEVRRWRGITFINDSKATNVDSTLVALQSFPGRLHVIMGGQHKGSPYTPLKALVKQKAKEILLIGEAAGLIQKDLNGAASLVPCGTLDRAVKTAAQNAREGDVVLLSPACASFDQFDNFEHRGRCFKEVVNGL